MWSLAWFAGETEKSGRDKLEGPRCGEHVKWAGLVELTNRLPAAMCTGKTAQTSDYRQSILHSEKEFVLCPETSQAEVVDRLSRAGGYFKSAQDSHCRGCRWYVS